MGLCAQSYLIPGVDVLQHALQQTQRMSPSPGRGCPAWTRPTLCGPQASTPGAAPTAACSATPPSRRTPPSSRLPSARHTNMTTKVHRRVWLVPCVWHGGNPSLGGDVVWWVQNAEMIATSGHGVAAHHGPEKKCRYWPLRRGCWGRISGGSQIPAGQPCGIGSWQPSRRFRGGRPSTRWTPHKKQCVVNVLF